MTPLLEVRDLRVSFPGESGPRTVVDGVSFSVEPGRVLGIVGESGSGKSISCLSLVGLSRLSGASVSGSATFRGRDLLQMPEAELQRLRGAVISMVFQDPMTSLNPVYSVGEQIAEQVRAHRRESSGAAWRRAVEMLDRVGIPDAARRARRYPHEFSGGMRQRVMIAMALSLDPALLIADEPTTALDVTVQAQILELIGSLQQEFSTAVVLISHDLGVVAELSDEVCVMYAGQVVERAPTRGLFERPQHPYTWGLLRSLPRIDEPVGARLRPIPGNPPGPEEALGGCRFAPRCPHAFGRCHLEPSLRRRNGAHLDRCWLDDEKVASIGGQLR